MQTMSKGCQLVATGLFVLSLLGLPQAALAEQATVGSDAGLTVASVTSASLAPEPVRNGIPMLTVFVDESDGALSAARAGDPDHEYGTFADLCNSAEHSVRGIGAVSIMVPEGYAGEYGCSTAPEGALDLVYIRGRGNDSWDVGENAPRKRAFKIKLQDKQDLFGMGVSKEWALMANSDDDTLLKNRITSWLGEQVGLPYTPRMVPADVTLVRYKDGSELERTYLGSYYLSELVDVGEGSVDIDKLGADVTADGDITGGYLLSYYTERQNSDEPESNVFALDSGMQLFTRSPEFESEDLTEGRASQRSYIRDYMAQLDELLTGADAIDDDRHEAIADLMDLRSAADYWWIQELSRNGDGFETSSTYLYKPRDGKLCWGPLWDFDMAWLVASDPTGFPFGFTSSTPWIDALRGNDPRFVELLKQRWQDPVDGLEAKLVELTRPGGTLDAYRDEMRASWEKDDTSFGRHDDDEGDGPEGFDEKVERLRAWIDGRRVWIGEHLDELDRVFVTVSYVVDGQEVKRERLNPLHDEPDWPEAPERDGYAFIEWALQESGEAGDEPDLFDDLVYVATYERVGGDGQPEETPTKADDERAADGETAGQRDTSKKGGEKKGGEKKGGEKKDAARRGSAKKGGAQKGAVKKGATKETGAQVNVAQKSVAQRDVAQRDMAQGAPRVTAGPLPQTGDVACPWACPFFLLASIVAFVAGVRSMKRA